MVQDTPINRAPGDDQSSDLIWRDGVPVSRRFDDPYYSLENGLAETGHVFLDGNDLPGRFRPGFHIAELGFGTGLNLAAALLSWRASGQSGPLHFTSFEAFPLPADALHRALSRFPEIAGIVDVLMTAVADGGDRFLAPDLHLTIVTGDARETLPRWPGKADAWFLDGFAPARNPELWEPTLMQAVADHTNPGGSFATYTAAGHIRRSLEAAGFNVERTAGYGRKRHMSRGDLISDVQSGRA